MGVKLDRIFRGYYVAVQGGYRVRISKCYTRTGWLIDVNRDTAHPETHTRHAFIKSLAEGKAIWAAFLEAEGTIGKRWNAALKSQEA